MRISPFFFHFLCFLAFSTYSQDEEGHLIFKFNQYENYFRTYQIIEVVEVRAQVVTISEDTFYSKILKKNCLHNYYYQYDKNVQGRPYIIKRNLRRGEDLSIELDLKTVIVKDMNYQITPLRDRISSLIDKGCGMRTYINLLITGVLDNGHEFRSDLLIDYKSSNYILNIHGKSSKLSLRASHKVTLRPTLLTNEASWQAVWEELDPLAYTLQINSP